MVIHKKTRLTPIQRQEIYESYHQENRKVSDLAGSYHVSRPTIYKIIRRGRKQDFTIHSSRNKRFTCLRYGIKRLSKIEKQIEGRLKKQAKRYNKDYPDQMLHGDTKRYRTLQRFFWSRYWRNAPIRLSSSIVTMVKSIGETPNITPL